MSNIMDRHEPGMMQTMKQNLTPVPQHDTAHHGHISCIRNSSEIKD
jgi:hypothetical protein